MIETADITPALESNADPRRIARALYWQGWRVTSIANQLELKRATVEAWKQRDEWDKAQPIERIESSLETRLSVLIAKPVKTGTPAAYRYRAEQYWRIRRGQHGRRGIRCERNLAPATAL